ncbi:MAG: hypothetical protein E3J52_10380 [Promethearchaeota archaeon]|nr:MAG: hypothetical protein E3J52_10380 [Candidatus Lokiarchaeota archaeon]
MKASSRLILATAIFVIILQFGSLHGIPERSRQNKMDLKIITSLDSGGFLAPAIIKNDSFAYNNFEFNLYSNKENSSYSIIIDNITITNSIIEEFKEIYKWKTSKSYISSIEVYILDHYYIYSNIFVFSSSVYNNTRPTSDNLISFTPRELKLYIQELQLLAFRDTFLGLLAIFITGYLVITKYKKETIKRIF